jgi:hypothetical protein
VTVEVVAQWIGILFVSVLAVGAAFRIVRDVILYRKPTVGPADHPPPREDEAREYLVGIGGQIKSWESFQRAHSAKVLAVLDSMALSFDKFAKGQDRWMKQMFGGDGGGYTDMNEAEAELRERAEGIRRRYGISWEEAMDRAKKTVVYEPDAKMRDNV